MTADGAFLPDDDKEENINFLGQSHEEDHHCKKTHEDKSSVITSNLSSPTKIFNRNFLGSPPLLPVERGSQIFNFETLFSDSI